MSSAGAFPICSKSDNLLDAPDDHLHVLHAGLAVALDILDQEFYVIRRDDEYSY
jgi:hypothetical protein